MTGDVREGLLILMERWLSAANCMRECRESIAGASFDAREGTGDQNGYRAGRGRLARQFLTESLLLSLAGGLIGVLVARWGCLRWFTWHRLN